MKKKMLYEYQKKINELIQKFEEIDIIHDYRDGYRYLGYSYDKKTSYKLAIRTGIYEEKVFTCISDGLVRRLLYIYEVEDILTVILVTEDIFRIMKENDSDELFVLLYEVLIETLYEALYTIDEELELMQ